MSCPVWFGEGADLMLGCFRSNTRRAYRNGVLRTDGEIGITSSLKTRVEKGLGSFLHFRAVFRILRILRML